MGSVCSCLCVEDFADCLHRDCGCFRCFNWRMIPAYSRLFQRGEVCADPSSVQGTSSASTGLVSQSSFSDTYCSPPRPLAYDDPRYSRLQHNRLGSRNEKSSNLVREESEPLRNDSSTEMESKNKGDLKGELKLCYPKSSVKHPQEDRTSGVTYLFSSYEDEDVCPTCLEEYTSENPRIVTQCSHHYHLGCIYEWMERSEVCPVCGKVMVFNETS